MPMHAPEHLTIIGDAPSYRIIVQSTTLPTIVCGNVRILQPCHCLTVLVLGLSKVDGRDWRTYSVAVGPLVITAGQDLAVRTSLAATASFRILQPLCLLLPFIAIAVWIVVGSGLAPLERTARSIARRSPTSLQPISTKGLSSELASLVNAINSLLARLGESLSAQQRFASDAAHELRTPLTALKLQVQLAQRAKTPEAQTINASLA